MRMVVYLIRPSHLLPEREPSRLNHQPHCPRPTQPCLSLFLPSTLPLVGCFTMNPNELPADRATSTIEDLVTERRPSLSVCNCGWYGFKSTVCPHHGVETGIKCGLTLSKKTGRPVFCPKKAPTFTLPEHVVPKACIPCEFNNSVSPSLQDQPICQAHNHRRTADMLVCHLQLANANQAGPSGTAQNSTASSSNNASANSNQTRSFT